MNKKRTKNIVEINDSEIEESDPIITIHIKSDSEEEYNEEKKKKPKSIQKISIDL